MTLGNDYVVQFETISKMRADANDKKLQIVSSSYPYIAKIPGTELHIPVNLALYSEREGTVTIHGYGLGKDRAAAYLNEDRERPWFSVAEREDGQLEDRYATQLSFTTTSTLEQHSWPVSYTHLTLPTNREV